jgi:hypothetical protein
MSAQLVCAIIVLGTSASLVGVKYIEGAGGTGLALFTALTSIGICVAFLLPSVAAKLESEQGKFVEVGVYFVWWVFWMASAASLTDSRIVGPRPPPCEHCPVCVCSPPPSVDCPPAAPNALQRCSSP